MCFLQPQSLLEVKRLKGKWNEEKKHKSVWMLSIIQAAIKPTVTLIADKLWCKIYTNLQQNDIYEPGTGSLKQTSHGLFERMDVGLSVFLQTTGKLIWRQQRLVMILCELSWCWTHITAKDNTITTSVKITVIQQISNSQYWQQRKFNYKSFLKVLVVEDFESSN